MTTANEIGEAEEAAKLSLEIWLEFISNSFDALAWPVSIFAIAFLFRSELKNVTSNLRRLKWGDVEAFFNESVAEAKEVANTLDPVDSETASLNDEQTYTLLKKAEFSPNDAITESYKRIEEKIELIANGAVDELVKAIPRIGNSWRNLQKMPHSLIAQGLYKAGVLSHAEMRTLERLRETRNLAAHHENSISSYSAKEFIKIASKLEDSLQSKLDTTQPQE